LLGATYGRTTLNGEGLQHQDGHSLLIASTIPTLYAYDPAFAFEVATIIGDGLHRMYELGEDVFYYLTLYNEKYAMPAMPEGAREGILSGLYKFKAAPEKLKHTANVFASGPIINQALKAQTILAEEYGVGLDVWSATNYKKLRHEAMNVQRWNMLHPAVAPKRSYLETVLEKEKGPFLAVSDNMRIVPDQIAPWVPGGLTTLGTDGFGRSDTRERLRRFFEVDAEMTVVATLSALAKKGAIEPKIVEKAIRDLDIDPEKKHPVVL
jgi:pyruvate dehydrogenase E1 component